MPAAASPHSPKVLIEDRGPVRIVTINRPEVRNAVDNETAHALAEEFRAFDADPKVHVAILTGAAGGGFCAGADLRQMASGARRERWHASSDGPMGPTRLLLDKPVLAAVEGHAVAGGLELALWCDLRIASATAVFGVFSRRWGVPLLDGGTVRLPRLIGGGRAMDMLLTGRPVAAEEAHAIGLAERLVPAGEALTAAVVLAEQIAAFPQSAVIFDRLSAHRQWGETLQEAIAREFADGITAPDAEGGAARFVAGAGRHGSFER